jgi:hypothetical protein
MGMALRAVADDRDLLALDEVDVGILIIIDAPFGVPYVEVTVSNCRYRVVEADALPAGARVPSGQFCPQNCAEAF